MLSTAQDYRKGLFSEQTHTWQATLDEHAIVFTTHPKNEPQVGTQWPDEDGYWTGNGSMPRAAQHGAVSINVYAPQFEPIRPAARRVSRTSTTRTRTSRRSGSTRWCRRATGRSGARATGTSRCGRSDAARWRTHDPSQVFTHGLTQPFDLVADGA